MFRNSRLKARFLGNAPFDEANYYYGNNFQVGGTDRGTNARTSLETSTGFRADERIMEDAWEALRNNRRLNIGDIEVVVKEGVIQLLGSVDYLSEKREAENSVEQVPGVVNIYNELKVRRIFG